jgi:predicted  nucleic acid-binding Zn-ribbon protein
MADNPQPPKANPPLPSSGMTGRIKAPTTKLPPIQAGRAGKVVVMLSSVAKLPPVSTQRLPVVSSPPVPPPVGSPPIGAAPLPPPTQVAPRPLPPLPPPLSNTTLVKLPPKTVEPAFVTLTPMPPLPPGKEEAAAVAPSSPPAKISGPIAGESSTPAPIIPQPHLVGAAPPPEPAPTRGEARKTGPIVLNPKPLAPPAPAKGDLRKTGIIKINPPAAEPQVPEESIFAQVPEPGPVPKPEGWKKLETGELPLPAGGIKSLDVFEHSQRLQPKPPPVPPVPIIREKPSLAPPRPTEPPVIVAKAGPALHPAPVALSPAHPLNIAPPMVEKARDESKEKLAPPVLPEPAKSSTPDAASLKMPAAPAMPKTPEMPKAPEMKAPAPAPPALPPPLPPSDAKEKLKQSAPIVLKSTSRIFVPGISDAKPALRPAVLPNRATRSLVGPAPETPPPVSEGKPPIDPAAQPAPLKSEAPSVQTESLAGVDPKPKIEPVPMVESVAKTEPSAPAEPAEIVKGAEPGSKPNLPVLISAAAWGGAGAAVAAATPEKKPFTPSTRAERAQKRRFKEIALFWVLALVTTVALYFGILHFGRDTRVEGQVIPPDGMTLSDEVWIVSDFSSLASGVADDLAKERVPLQQEIQEAQDHVQHVQADIASREERIRLIREEIQAAKDEINNLIKKSRDATQAIWDGEGAEIDQEYESRLESLRQAIASRAASLKLQYQADPAFPSPEVWANAYRLALYEVPAGVDGVKEHQWLADQMKQWRDFEKSLDDRREQLREKAAQLKLEPAPKLADLNAKIDDLNQRIAGTQTEEEPLKVELNQAQGDLSAAQSAEATLDDKYYGQLYSLPSENISYHIPVRPNGRFTWVPDNPIGEGEVRRLYWVFSRATRADGRQYWALLQVPLEKNKTTEMTIEPGGFESTKRILRPNLTPEEWEQ